jgi:hypothetical protein
MAAIIDSALRFQDRFNTLGVPTAAVGGLALAIWGEPRLSRELDMKVLMTGSDAKRVVDLLRDDYEWFVANPEEALERYSVLVVRDRFGTRIAVMLSEFDIDTNAIERAVDVELVPGINIRVITPEDLILYKFISTRLPDRQDIEGIVQRQREKLDVDYLLTWLRRLEEGLEDPTLIATFQGMYQQV